MNGTYEVVPIVRRSRIEPGETAEIEVFIAGSGDVESAKLQTLHTQEDLIAEEEPGEMVYSVDLKEGEDGTKEPVLGEEALNQIEIDRWGTMALITDAIFYTPFETDSSETIQLNDSDFPFQPIVGEAAHDGYPPILLRLNTKNGAQPGDYRIPFILTYGNQEEPEQSTAAVEIHVQSWAERHRKALEIVAVVLTLSIVITSIISAAAAVYSILPH